MYDEVSSQSSTAQCQRVGVDLIYDEPPIPSCRLDLEGGFGIKRAQLLHASHMLLWSSDSLHRSSHPLAWMMLTSVKILKSRPNTIYYLMMWDWPLLHFTQWRCSIFLISSSAKESRGRRQWMCHGKQASINVFREVNQGVQSRVHRSANIMSSLSFPKRVPQY